MKIERFRGDTRPDICTISSVRTRKVADITGSRFVMTLSSVPDPTDTSSQIYSIEGNLFDPQVGVVHFEPTAEQVNRVGYFYYDIQMTDTYGKIHTLVTGTYTYIQDITK